MSHFRSVHTSTIVDAKWSRLNHETLSYFDFSAEVAFSRRPRLSSTETPDMKEKVATAMADKYWMDVLIRHESHPMVARLVPEGTPPETSSH
jgi:hypothetical protein